MDAEFADTKDDKYKITWEELDYLIIELAYKIPKTKYNSIFGVPKNGLYIANILSKYLDIPVWLDRKSYH